MHDKWRGNGISLKLLLGILRNFPDLTKAKRIVERFKSKAAIDYSQTHISRNNWKVRSSGSYSGTPFYGLPDITSLRTADLFPVVASLSPKNNVCEPEWPNHFCDVKLFVLMLATQIKGKNTARVTPRALACLGFWREFPNTLWNGSFTTFNKVSCDLECWLLCEATASYVMYVMLAFGLHFIKFGST